MVVKNDNRDWHLMTPVDTRWHSASIRNSWESGGYNVNYCHAMLRIRAHRGHEKESQMTCNEPFGFFVMRRIGDVSILTFLKWRSRFRNLRKMDDGWVHHAFCRWLQDDFLAKSLIRAPWSSSFEVFITLGTWASTSSQAKLFWCARYWPEHDCKNAKRVKERFGIRARAA